ncbi:hypothetical protein MEME101129_24925 [Methylobacterium mesophilicum]
MLALGEVRGGQKLAQKHRLALGVRQFDADGVAAGDDRHACRDRRHRAGDVVGQRDHAAGLGARCRLELVERHDRAGPHRQDVAAHAEIAERRLEKGRVLLQGVGRDLARRGGATRGRQQIEGRQGVILGPDLWCGRPAGRHRRGGRRRDPRGGRLRTGGGRPLRDLLVRVRLVLLRGQQGCRPAGGRLRFGRRVPARILAVERGLEDRLAPRLTRLGALGQVLGPGQVRIREGAPGRERRGGAVERLGPAGPPRLDPPRQGDAHPHQALGEGADAHEAEARLVGILALVATPHGRMPDGIGLVMEGILLGGPEPAGAGQAEDRHRGVDEADEVGRRRRHRPHDHPGHRQQAVPGDAAEPGGQRPAGGGRQGARHRARGAEADDPERQAHAALGQVALAHQPDAPEHGGQHEREGTQTEDLHGEVGHDGARLAEHVVGRVVGGVVEARVVDRPRGERHGERDRAGEQDEPSELRQALAQEGANAVDVGVVGRRGTAKRAHAGPDANGDSDPRLVTPALTTC